METVCFKAPAMLVRRIEAWCRSHYYSNISECVREIVRERVMMQP